MAAEIPLSSLLNAVGGIAGTYTPHSGGIERIVLDKLRDLPSLLDFIPVAQHAAIFAGTSTYDCTPALLAAVNSRQFNVNAYYSGGPRIHIPGGKFYFATPVELKRTVIIEGDGNGQSGGFPTWLEFETSGFTVNRYNTLNGGVETTPTTAADASIIRGLRITSKAPKGAGPHWGIWMRARALIEDCYVEGFTGNGVQIITGGEGSFAGNANCWQINRLTVANNGKNGLYIAGADSNAGTSVGVNAVANGEWGICDEAFLANTHIGAHADANGYANSYKGDDRAALCTYGGNRYAVIVGKTVEASTVVPGTDSTVWELASSGGAYGTQIPEWVSGMAWKEGGSYRGASANAPTAWVGCYEEGGQSPSQIVGPQVIVGGQMAPTASSRAVFMRGNPGGELQLRRGIQSTAILDGGTFSIAVGSGVGGSGRVAEWAHSANFAGGVSWQYYGVDHRIIDGNTIRALFYLTGKNTLRTYGRSAVVPYTVEIASLHIGEGNGARQHTTLAAAPTTGTWARGDVCWNNAPSASGFAGWICTTAGTPGTWKTFGAISA